MKSPRYVKMMKRRSPALVYALQHGFSAEEKGRHLKITRGPHVLFVAFSASDTRSDKNLLAAVKRCLRDECRCNGVLYAEKQRLNAST